MPTKIGSSSKLGSLLGLFFNSIGVRFHLGDLKKVPMLENPYANLASFERAPLNEPLQEPYTLNPKDPKKPKGPRP